MILCRFGKVDILVSNAGIEHFGKLEEITKQDFVHAASALPNRVFSTNVAGQLFVTPFYGENNAILE